jgi:hypothetical protein
MSLNFNATIHLPELTVDEAFNRQSGEPMISLSHPGGSWIDMTAADLPELDAPDRQAHPRERTARGGRRGARRGRFMSAANRLTAEQEMVAKEAGR